MLDVPVGPKLIFHLRKVLTENPELTNLLPSFGCGRIASNGTYYPTHKIKFRTDPANDAFTYDSNSEPTIRICDLSPKHITNKSIYRSSNSSDDVSKYYHRNMYNSNWTGQYNAKRLGINVDRSIKVKGYVLNFNDMRTAIKESFSNYRYDSIIDCLWEIYYIGERNCVLGISANTGILYIRKQTLSKMLLSNNDEAIQRGLKNLLKCFNFTLQKYESLNIRNYVEDMTQLIENDVINKVVNTNEFSRRYYDNAGPNAVSQKKFMEDIKHHIDESIKTSLRGSIFGVNEKYSYSDILSNIINKHKTIEKSIFDDGFAKGMRIGMKLEMIGWVPVNINFPDNSNSTDVWWANDVNIVPSTFIFREERYEIPEDKRKAKITKLFINQNGIMRCQGEHPNVSGSKVCMGDLTIDYSKSVSEIQDALDRAKSLLDIINYDSAYSSRDRDELLKCSTKVRSLSTRDIENGIPKKTELKIKEVNFSDNDDEEEVEETATAVDDSETVIVHNEEVIASLIDDIEPDDPNRQGARQQVPNHVEDDENEEQIQVQTHVISNNVDTIEQIRVVEETGERRPVVFYTTSGDAVIIQAPSEHAVDSHELVLGDINLL